jgi:hypothetical protein
MGIASAEAVLGAACTRGDATGGQAQGMCLGLLGMACARAGCTVFMTVLRLPTYHFYYRIVYLRVPFRFVTSYDGCVQCGRVSGVLCGPDAKKTRASRCRGRVKPGGARARDTQRDQIYTVGIKTKHASKTPLPTVRTPAAAPPEGASERKQTHRGTRPLPARGTAGLQAQLRRDTAWRDSVR